jgi:hypothetical protein
MRFPMKGTQLWQGKKNIFVWASKLRKNMFLKNISLCRFSTYLKWFLFKSRSWYVRKFLFNY